MDNKIPSSFPATIYGNVEPYNDVLSKARCRIFYKFGNRNGTYITEDFAQKLVASLPYVPVKGIYSSSDEDFTDHGASRDLGKIYGIVPEHPNVNWETFVDEDGVAREYACCDVLLFTALYKEARQIVGKSQSMELYAPNLQGEWQDIDGARYYVFTDGCFLGLQALGEEVEPCFEGASFYELYEPLKKLLDKLLIYVEDKGGIKVDKDEVNGAGASGITESPEDSGTPNQPAAHEYQLTLSESEYNEITKLHEWNDGSYEGLYQKVVDLAEANSTFGQKVEELQGLYDASQEENASLKETIAAYEKEKEEAENAKKEAVREKYSKKLSEEEIASISFEDKTAEELEKCYAYALVKANENTIFSEANDGAIPKDTHSSGIESILDKYM